MPISLAPMVASTPGMTNTTNGSCSTSKTGHINFDRL